MSKIHVLELDFLVHEIHIPDLDSVAVNAEQLRIGVVVELDLVGGASTDWVAADSFSSFNIPDNELVIILSTKGRKVSLVVGK